MISLQQLSVRAGTKLLFSDANLSIYPGQKVGLIGQNGVGKTTLFKALMGEVPLDSGQVSFPADWLIGYVEQEVESTQLKVLDFVCDGDSLYAQAQKELQLAEEDGEQQRIVAAYDQLDRIRAYEVPTKARQLLYGLGFSDEDLQKSLKQFSGGWQVRLKLARALMQRADLLLLDEPTNHLDIEAVAWLEQWLKSYEGALLVISHDRDFLDEVVQGIAHIDQQKIYYYSGNFAAFERQKNERLMQQQALHDKQKQQMQHLKSFIERFKAKASKAKQAQSRVKALQRMETVAAVQALNPFHFQFAEPKYQPDPMMELRGLDFAYGDKAILKHTDLVLRAGDRIGLVGINGSGKTTLIKLLVGELQAQKGKIVTAKGVKFGYFSQHQLETLSLEQSPLQHLLKLPDAPSDQEARDFLGGFGFSNQQCLESIECFSGGEKARLALAIIVFQQPNLIILDEPTNHLDMETRDALEIALQEFSGALIVVSHDKHLLASIADQFWWVHEGEVSHFHGDLDDYLQAQLKRIRQQASEQKSEEGKNNSQNRKQLRQANAQQRKLLEGRLKPYKSKQKKVEDELAKIQQQLAEHHALMEDQSLYEDGNQARLQECLKQEAICQQRHEELEMQWLELEEEIQSIREEFENE
ncbi:ABC-F family ATP-binding cassette domain-containing protein [Thiomicrorhabdus sp.]|uniref:ABC-F family ATP-binding cassette domain-containing protein n=1 Tax=Thiomicrorhabdus sp. TaxID=2039724 RepID=UPI0029C7B285|nr:ATP-binding cassette domain-containing protein [Thiomicrorhabdus sp.]